MPTRLLDTMTTEVDPELLLVNGSNLITKYAALSHGWGLQENLKTTTENIHSMLQNIALHTLPQTLRDAVPVCRDLGIRYIWIDSLYIIQDNLAKWRREANRMAMVYGKAFLVIVASASWGNEVGMFPKREATQCVLKLTEFCYNNIWPLSNF